jgi:hypothetical protein
MIRKFENAIDKAYEAATSRVVLLGLCDGGVMGDGSLFDVVCDVDHVWLLCVVLGGPRDGM